MKDRNYRNSEAPVPLHALCNGLVSSMHAEIVALHELLQEATLRSDNTLDDLESLIAGRIEDPDCQGLETSAGKVT